MTAVYGPYPAVILDFHDGDTFHANLDLGFGIILAAYNTAGKAVLSCRVLGIDTPELGTSQGPAAKAAAERLCPPGTAVMITSHGWDKYGGRFDGVVTLPDGSDLAVAMIATGLAQPYTGKGPKPPWPP